MAVQAICSTSQGNLGAVCTKGNGKTVITGIILTTASYEFASYTDFADSDVWDTAVKAKQIFPLMNIQEFDDNTEDTSYYESQLGDQIKLRAGKYRYNFKFYLGLQQHQELQKFSQGSFRYFTVDSDNNIYGYSDDDTAVKGFSISNLEAEKMTAATADTPALSPLNIVESNATQWNDFGISINPDWVAEDLSGLTNVDITTVGTPTALELILNVGAPTGKLNSDGSLQEVPITGIVEADFAFFDAGGAAQTAPSSMTDNADGTYTFVFAALATGTANLVVPASMVSTGLLIESTGAASFTI